MFDQISSLVSEIEKTKAKRVLIQLPDGLKTKAIEIAGAVEKAGIDVVISANPSYGACDLADSDAAAAQCDLLVHIGHSRFYKNFKTDVPVLYYPWEMGAEMKDIDFSVIREKRVGVVTTIQHMRMLGEVAAMLKDAGKEVVIGGQVLGCWAENAGRLGADAILFVGTGNFHPLGITGKRIYSLNLEKMTVEVVDTALFEKRRYANVYNAKDARTFAVLVSSKKGQYDMAKAREIVKRLREKDKKAFIVIMDEISDAKLAGIRADAFINTACPRLADDVFKKPFVNASDVELVLA